MNSDHKIYFIEQGQGLSYVSHDGIFLLRTGCGISVNIILNKLFVPVSCISLALVSSGVKCDLQKEGPTQIPASHSALLRSAHSGSALSHNQQCLCLGLAWSARLQTTNTSRKPRGNLLKEKKPLESEYEFMIIFIIIKTRFM